MALLTNAGAYTEAVELALQVDLALAKATADKPEDDPALRRALWLRCAHSVIRQAQEGGAEGSPLRRAIDFLSETDGLLRIEDVLPFFPDVTKIDDFKAGYAVFLSAAACVRRSIAVVLASLALDHSIQSLTWPTVLTHFDTTGGGVRKLGGVQLANLAAAARGACEQRGGPVMICPRRMSSWLLLSSVAAVLP